MPIPLSVLDFDQQFLYAPEIGPFVESLGYHRYWFAEHVPQPNVELFIGLLAGLTSQIRIGSGGVLLRYRDVSQSALNFQFLTAAFHGRIDAGFCAGGPTISRPVNASSESAPNYYEDFLRRAETWITDLQCREEDKRVPQIWSLGTGRGSAHNAATFGVAYAYSLFHTPSDDPTFVNHYRKHFRATKFLPAPHTMLSFAGLCAATQTEAELRLSGHKNDFIRPNIWGDQSRCLEQLRMLVDRYRPDELQILDLSRTLHHKKESYRFWIDVVGALS